MEVTGVQDDSSITWRQYSERICDTYWEHWTMACWNRSWLIQIMDICNHLWVTSRPISALIKSTARIVSTRNNWFIDLKQKIDNVNSNRTGTGTRTHPCDILVEVIKSWTYWLAVTHHFRPYSPQIAYFQFTWGGRNLWPLIFYLRMIHHAEQNKIALQPSKCRRDCVQTTVSHSNAILSTCPVDHITQFRIDDVWIDKPKWRLHPSYECHLRNAISGVFNVFTCNSINGNVPHWWLACL